ncbi:hypothetical protein [Rossellomorea aquimaris]|uniref:hypothetical protein n=1 Tax=Rossellomorea aquimaris TaxID=189382 RepID=UPI0005C94061|nr:hypothetical protein [Rossellomorea aquimaris]
MKHAVIYLRQNKKESIEELLESADKYIADLKNQYKIINVFFDNFNDRSNLDNFLNSAPNKFDIIIIDHIIEDEFDLKLIKELSRMEKFQVVYLIRIP